MRALHQTTHAVTGETTEAWIDMPGLLTEAEGIAQMRLEANAAHNAAIVAQLDANDVRVMRALLEGDTTKIDAHKAAQAALRAQLIR